MGLGALGPGGGGIDDVQEIAQHRRRAVEPSLRQAICPETIKRGYLTGPRQDRLIDERPIP